MDMWSDTRVESEVLDVALALPRGAQPSPLRRAALALAAISLATVLVWIGWQVATWWRGQLAVAHLVTAVRSTPDGQIVDLAQAFDLSWEQAVVVGPYASGDDANQLLGFKGFEPGEMMNAQDTGMNLIFASDTSVLATLELPVSGFSFDVDTVEFTPFRIAPQDARFVVIHGGAVPMLRGPVLDQSR
jgi:hypothetical protein